MLTLDVEANFGDSVVSSSLRWGLPGDLVSLAASSGPLTPDHGPEFQFEAPEPAKHEAILWCGCSLFFPVPPMVGELLYCTLHDDWFKSRPGSEKAAKPVPTRLLKCDTEGCGWGNELPTGRAYTYAKRHAYGVKGHRKNAPHEVLIGTKTDSGITWKKYEEKK